MSVSHRSGEAVIVAGVVGVVAWLVRRGTPRRRRSLGPGSIETLRAKSADLARDPSHHTWVAGVRRDVERGISDDDRLSKADLLKRRDAVRSAS